MGRFLERWGMDIGQMVNGQVLGEMGEWVGCWRDGEWIGMWRDGEWIGTWRDGGMGRFLERWGMDIGEMVNGQEGKVY